MVVALLLVLMVAGISFTQAASDPRQVTLRWLRLGGVIALALLGVAGTIGVMADLALNTPLTVALGAFALLLVAQLVTVQLAMRTTQQLAAGGAYVAGCAAAAIIAAPMFIAAPAAPDAAETAARKILDDFVDDAGALHRLGRHGEISGDALLEDYAFLVRGLLGAFRARAQMTPDADSSWLLESAVRLTGTARSRFWDDEAGAWFDTRPEQTDLLVRPRTVDDGAVPSGQSVMLHNLLTLAEITGEQAFLGDAGRTLESLSRAIADHPVRTANSTAALARVMADHPHMFETFAFGSAPTLSDQQAEAAADEPVQVFSDVDSVTVPAQGAATLNLQFRIADGHHVNAPEPGVEGLTGLSIEIEGSTGLEAIPEWPEPELYEGVALNPASDQRLMVYTGDIVVPVKIVRTGAFVAGTPRIRITWQVCTETECLAPVSGALDVAIVAE